MSLELLIDARCITCKPCGVRRVAEQYLQNLPKNIHTKIIINKSATFNLQHDNNIDIIRVPNFCTRFNFLLDMILISWIVIRFRPNIFLSLHSFLPIFSWLPKNRIFLFHDHFSAIRKDFFEARGRLAHSARLFFWIVTFISTYRANKIITPSHFIEERLSLFFPKSIRKISVCYNPVQFVATDRVIKNLDDNSVSILFVGNSKKYKGLDILLEAWEKYSQKSGHFINKTLHIVSNQSIEQLTFQFAHIDLKSVVFHSRITDQELNLLRAKAKAFVVPSREEGFGLPVIENLIWNKPMILSDIPVFREIICSSERLGIIWFQADSVNCLVEKLASFDVEIPSNRSIHDIDGEACSSLLTKYRDDIASERFFSEVIGDFNDKFRKN